MTEEFQHSLFAQVFSKYKMYNVHLTAFEFIPCSHASYHMHLYRYVYLLYASQNPLTAMLLLILLQRLTKYIWFFEIQHKSLCTSSGNIKTFYKIFNFCISNTQDELWIQKWTNQKNWIQKLITNIQNNKSHMFYSFIFANLIYHSPFTIHCSPYHWILKCTLYGLLVFIYIQQSNEWWSER